MVTEEFIRELRRVKDQFTWKLLPDDEHAFDRRAQARLRVRAEHRTGGTRGVLMDPIGAVCYALTQKSYEDESWQDAANSIELSLISAADLLAAANDRTWKGNPGRREQDAYLISLRQQLLDAVQLKAS